MKSFGRRVQLRPITLLLKVLRILISEMASISLPHQLSIKRCLDTCRQLEREGYEVTYLKPGEDGITHPEVGRSCIREDTVLVSIMHANNEIGVVNDVAAIGAIARARKIIFPCRWCTKSAGKIPVDVDAMKIDLLSMCQHTKCMAQKVLAPLYVVESLG